jgi:hypothetical protein
VPEKRHIHAFFCTHTSMERKPRRKKEKPEKSKMEIVCTFFQKWNLY